MPDRRADIARRRRNLLIGALAAFAAGILVGSVSGDEDAATPAQRASDNGAAPPADERPEQPIDRLTLRQQVGQLIVLRFAGTSAPGYVRSALEERRAAGAILFRDNVAGPEQLRALTAELSDAGGNPIVAVDQEGGEIRILPWAPPEASAPEQSAAGTVREDSEAAAEALRATGVNVTLAPVGDVPTVEGAALASRAFSDDPAAAGEAMAQAIEGWRAGGVAATAKHFPGLGGATVNTDDGPATIERSSADIEAADLPPFEAAIDAGTPLVMVGHALYPALDDERIASQSQPIIETLLRERLGFEGVVITDSMEAQASLATADVATASERAIRAGADIVLLTGQGSYRPVFRHLLEQARGDPALRERVRESATRVLALRERGPRPP